MVDGVGNNPQQNQTLKLKGKDGKSINLQNLKGLQKTKGNEALFKMYDKDNDGIISDKEAIVMQKSLYSLSNGNGKISQREMKALFGDNNKAAFEALSKLADQQATAKGEKYTEVNGNTTTSFYNSNFGVEGASREDVTQNPDGSTVTTYQNGTSVVKNKDGSQNVIKKDGTIVQYDKEGKHTGTIAPDGTEITFPDNDTAVWTKDGKTIKTLQSSNGKEVTKNFGADGNVTSITVSGRGKDGDNTYNSEMKFNSEEDFQNNRPASEVRNRGLATETHIVYKYDANGNVQADSVNLAGESTRTYKNANGEEIQPEQFGKPLLANNEIPEGDIDGGKLAEVTITAKKPSAETIATKRELQAQLGDNYEVGYARDGSIEVRDKNGTLLAALTEKANSGLQTTDIPAADIDGGELAEVTITAKQPSAETIATRQELQAQLGDNYEVSYAKDGSIEVRDKSGEEVPYLTQMANAKANPDKLAAEILQTGDQNNSQTLDKAEFREFIMSQLGTNLSDNNKVQLENLIESSFASLDSIEQDGTISRAELEKKSFDILSQISSAVEEMENNQFQKSNMEMLGVDDPKESQKGFTNPELNPDDGPSLA